MKQFPSRALRFIGVSLLAGLPVITGSALAAGDVRAGAGKAYYCAYCHGADGNPPDHEAPRLAGRDAACLAAMMHQRVRQQSPTHPMKRSFLTADLEDQDMDDLAAFFSGQPIRARPGIRAARQVASPSATAPPR